MKKSILENITGNAELCRMISGKDYILYRLSKMQIGKNAAPGLLDNPEEIIEAHFFNRSQYIHIFTYEDHLIAAVFEDSGSEGNGEGQEKAAEAANSAEADQDEVFEEKQYMRDKTYKVLLCRKYISYDKPYGQAYVSMMRPVELGEK